MIDRALNQTNVAKLLGVHRKTVKKWTDDGVLPVWFVDDSGRVVYSAATIEAHQRRSGEIAAERKP